MEYRVVQYFLAVAKAESISKAADMIHITQPTLSRQIAQLEEELGTKLFNRGRRLTLTESGQLLRRRAEEMVKLMESTEAELRDMDHVSGTIAISCGGLLSTNVLVRYMVEFKKMYPDVIFQLETNTADVVTCQIDYGEIDFGLLMEPVDVEKYEYIRMNVEEVWRVTMRRDMPYADREFITREDLIQMPLVISKRNIIVKELASWMGGDLSKLNIYATHNLLHNSLELLRLADVYALSVNEPLIATLNDEFISIPLKPMVRTHSVFAWKRHYAMSSAQSKFLEYVKKRMAEDEEKGVL